ncbi:RDD family protein [Massilia soli]|uniref:RDD family protein n=1 Tax=Massilia soli TaxID=2792854 RepID=A0ABS7SQT0_9BURK|nr:RDD family protein [Massilia soli]MBZ2208303.1 RDD family protein [Massilia soli]
MLQQQESEIEYAGFWSRVGATLIDTIILMIVSIPLLLAFYGTSYWENTSFVAGPAGFLISYVLPAVAVILLWIKFSATQRKMAIGATVVDARTGGKPGTSQFLIRYLGYFVSTIPLFLGLIWVGIDPRKQGWHDKMAGTVVVKRKAGGAVPVRFDQAG